MKRFLLHIFLCGVLAVAPSMAWSEEMGGDSWWEHHNGAIMPNAEAREMMHDLRVDNLSVDKLVKFIVALPRGPEFAHRVMNDPANKITFLETSTPLVVDDMVSVGLTATGAVIAVVGFVAALVAACGPLVVPAAIAALVGFVGFGACIVGSNMESKYVGERTIQSDEIPGIHTKKDKFVRTDDQGTPVWAPIKLPQIGQRVTLYDGGTEMQSTEACHIIFLPNDNNNNYIVRFKSRLRVGYKIVNCLGLKSYTGYIQITDDDNTGQSTLQVVTQEQGTFEWRPDTQIFERINTQN